MSPLLKLRMKEYLLVFLFAIFFVYNFYIQHQEFHGLFYHINNFLYIYTLLKLWRYKSEYFYFFCLMYFVCFHQYSSDPYNETFSSFQAGYYKLIVFSIFVARFRPQLQLRGGSFLLVFILFATIIQFSFYVNGSLSYLVYDFILFIPAIPYLLEFRAKALTEFTLNKTLFLLYKFTLFIPFVCLLIYALDLHTVLYGSYYFFYGHTISLLLMYSGVYFFTKRKALKISADFPFVIVNALILLQSLQSAYILILISFLLFITLMKRSFKSFFSIIVLIFLLVIVGYNATSGSWLELKVGQILRLASIGMNDLESMPSLYVRVYSLLNIIDTNSKFEMFFGRGLGATYVDSLGAFNSRVIHSATFPLKEISTGTFHLVHETFVKIFLQGGLLGLFLVNFFWLKKLLQAKELPFMFILIFTSFLWLSSIQVTFFLGVLVLLISQSFESRKSIYEK